MKKGRAVTGRMPEAILLFMSDPRVEFAVPVPEDLQRVIRRALPPEWRECYTVFRLRDGMILKIQDADAREHTLEARWLSLGTPGFLRGQRLAYAYRSDAPDDGNEGIPAAHMAPRQLPRSTPGTEGHLACQKGKGHSAVRILHSV